MTYSLHEKAVSPSKHYHSLEAELLVVLEKIKDQKIYLELGFESLFSYCVNALNLSESKAWSFSALLKKSKLVPEIKEEIKSGGLTLCKAARIVSVVTPENKTEWIEKAKTEIEKNSNLASGNVSKKSSDANGSVTVKLVPIIQKRKPLPAALKHQLNLRDQGKCQFQSHTTRHKCESESFIEFDHIRPVSNGGTNELTNLITLCSRHHAYI